MARTTRNTQEVQEQQDIGEIQETRWLSRAELNDYALMARKEDWSLDDLFAIFDQDEAGYHLNGMRINAKVLSGMYYQQGRRAEMQARMMRAKAEAKRQNEGK